MTTNRNKTETKQKRKVFRTCATILNLNYNIDSLAVLWKSKTKYDIVNFFKMKKWPHTFVLFVLYYYFFRQIYSECADYVVHTVNSNLFDVYFTLVQIFVFFAVVETQMWSLNLNFFVKLDGISSVCYWSRIKNRWHAHLLFNLQWCITSAISSLYDCWWYDCMITWSWMTFAFLFFCTNLNLEFRISNIRSGTMCLRMCYQTGLSRL